MKTQHTPGPYGYSTAAFAKGEGIKTTGTYYSIGTSNGDFHVFGTGLGINPDSTVKMLAAAPELLEALYGTMKALKRALEKYDPDNTDYEWIGEANEAIKKATED